VWTTGRRRKGGVKGKKGERGEDRRKRQERGNAEKGVAKGGRERRESPGSARAQRRPDSRRHSSAALEAHSSSSTAKPARTIPLPKIGRPDARLVLVHAASRIGAPPTPHPLQKACPLDDTWTLFGKRQQTETKT